MQKYANTYNKCQMHLHRAMSCRAANISRGLQSHLHIGTLTFVLGSGSHFCGSCHVVCRVEGTCGQCGWCDGRAGEKHNDVTHS